MSVEIGVDVEVDDEAVYPGGNGVAGGALLMESGDALLMETGDTLLMEDAA